jgi:hypothetical protein
VTTFERIPGGTLEAVQWTGENAVELNEWTKTEGSDGQINAGFIWNFGAPEGPARLWVEANGTWLPIEIGEWVAKDSLGFYPIKDEQFRKSWRPAFPIAKPRTATMSGGELLAYLGTDGAKWAEEFAATAATLTVDDEPWSGQPGGFIHGWFANAIEAGISAGRAKEADPKTHEINLNEYTNNSRGGDGQTVRVGDLVVPTFTYHKPDPIRVTRIFKPTLKSRVVYEFETPRGNQAIPNRGHAHYYTKVV